jgi:hypothetical protein
MAPPGTLLQHNQKKQRCRDKTVVYLQLFNEPDPLPGKKTLVDAFACVC